MIWKFMVLTENFVALMLNTMLMLRQQGGLNLVAVAYIVESFVACPALNPVICFFFGFITGYLYIVYCMLIRSSE